MTYRASQVVIAKKTLEGRVHLTEGKEYTIKDADHHPKGVTVYLNITDDRGLWCWVASNLLREKEE